MRSRSVCVASSLLTLLALSFPLTTMAQFGAYGGGYGSFGGYPGPAYGTNTSPYNANTGVGSYTQSYGSSGNYGNPYSTNNGAGFFGRRSRNQTVQSYQGYQSGQQGTSSYSAAPNGYGTSSGYYPQNNAPYNQQQQQTPDNYQNPQQALQQYNNNQQNNAGNAPTPQGDGEDDKLDQYAGFSDAGTRYYRAGQLTQAIDEFEKARLIAPDNYIPVVYNNLAAAYIRRGNYFHDHDKQDQNALSDFRKAYYYLEPAWPEGEARNATHSQNRTIAKNNLFIAYQNLGMGVPSKAKHLEMVSQLRTQSNKFPEAIAEAYLAYDMDHKDSNVAKTLGDLFTVVNDPEKSKKYYALVANNVGSKDDKASGGASGSRDDLLVQLGNAQYKTGEIDKAITNLDKALVINPSNEGALNILLKIWKAELLTNPGSVTAHANLGSIYQKKKDYVEALKQYNAAEHFADSDPKTPFDVKKQIRLNIGTLFQAQKRYDLAMKAYDTVLQVEPKQVTANYYKATLLEEMGKTPEAIDAYNKLLAIDPTNQTAQDKLLALIKRQSEPLKENESLQAYANRFPGNATIQAQVGEEFHQKKDLTNAAIYYQRALAIDPRLSSVWANLGALYQAQGKADDSAEAYRKAQALDPQNSTYKQLAKSAVTERGQQAYEQAVALQQKGKAQESLELFRKALAVEDRSDIRFDYGIALQTTGQLDAAIAEYKKVMTADPKNADAIYAIGTAYQQKKNYAQAEASYKSALAIKPGYADASKALVDLKTLQASSQLEEAIKAYNNKQYPVALTKLDATLAKNPQDAMAYYYKGLVYDAQKKTSSAVQNYRSATRYKPDFSDAYYALGVDLDTAKDSSGAKLAFSKFVELSGSTSEDDFVKYARERLKTLSSTKP
jgi:tetratricopeptide (TPR) repeat protein